MLLCLEIAVSELCSLEYCSGRFYLVTLATPPSPFYTSMLLHFLGLFQNKKIVTQALENTLFCYYHLHTKAVIRDYHLLK